MIGKRVPLGGMKESLSKERPLEPRPAESKGAGQGKCWAQSLLGWDSSKCKGLKAGVGAGNEGVGGGVSEQTTGGQWGGKYGEQGRKWQEPGRVRPHRSAWKVHLGNDSVKRSPRATPERVAEAVEEKVCEALPPNSPQDTALLQHLSP